MCIRDSDWAERTGLKILIDLHTVPGSQNGFDNGGLTGVVRWHHSPRAVAYALNVLACLARRYRDRAALFGIEVLKMCIRDSCSTCRAPAHGPTAACCCSCR